MTATRNPPEAPQDGLWQALDEGAKRLRGLSLSRPADPFNKAVLRLFKERDPTQTLDSIEKVTLDLSQIATILQETYQAGREAEQAEAAAEPFGAASLNALRRKLEQLRGADDSAWLGLWVSAWADALAALRWSRCDEIVALADPASPGAGLARDLKAVSALLDGNQPLAALPAIENILARAGVPVGTATKLRILRTRILRRWAKDLGKAQKAASEAVAGAAQADHPLRTLALIAQAEVCQDLDQLDDAHLILDAAMGTQDATLDLLLAMASLATAERRFGQANELYDAAILRFGAEVVEPRLLREVPGNLLWRWSRQLTATDKRRALSLLDEALQRGIKGKGEFPAKKATVERAQILEDLGRHDEAAQAYHTAGDQYATSQSPKAVGLFQKACELAPGVAKYHWSYGDALRLRAADTTGIVNLDTMNSARQALEAGFALETPGKKHAWAFASQALVLDSLGQPDDPAVQIERALLLDPDYMIGFWLLSMLLRKRGFVEEALAAAQEAYRRDDDDFRTVGQLDLALRDHGDLAAALQVIDGYLQSGGNDPEALIHKSGLLLRINEPRRALEFLAETSIESAGVVYRRGTAYDCLDHEIDARRCFEDLWNRREDLGNAAIVAWSAYRIGLLDEAVERFTELAEQATLAPPAVFDLYLAQVRLVRGDQGKDDVAAGGRILTAAIKRTNIVDDLRWLAQEFTFIRRDISGKPHEIPVLEILAGAQDLADYRGAVLRSRHRDSDLPAVRLADARIALASKRFDDAFGRYLDFVRQGDPPEARLGLISAMQSLLDQGDEQLQAGGLPAARAKWDPLSPAVALLSPEEPVRQALQARLGLAALEEAGPLDEAASTLLDASTEQAIVGALQKFARNVPTLWAHHDGLSAMAAQDTRSAAKRAKFRSVAAAVPIGSVYALNQRLMTGSAAVPAVSPIEITVGAAHTSLVDSDEITFGIGQVRSRLTDETGLQIPGVGVRRAGDDSLDIIEYLIYQRAVARLTIPAGPQNTRRVADVVLAHFERAIRDNLFRLISVDDVDLWRQGWNVLQAPESEPLWTVTDEFSRLRLARLLRMLLREGLPISDRNSILGGFAEAENSDPCDALDALTVIRRKLYPAILGPDRDIKIHALPETLEARVAIGLSASSNQWELDRGAAASLAKDLRQWCAEQSKSGPVTVQVVNGRTRPFVWHLLAAVRPRIYVVAREELP
jgi:tetratricopeptide (TPR) repeat protein